MPSIHQKSSIRLWWKEKATPILDRAIPKTKSGRFRYAFAVDIIGGGDRNLARGLVFHGHDEDEDQWQLVASRTVKALAFNLNGFANARGEINSFDGKMYVERCEMHQRGPRWFHSFDSLYRSTVLPEGDGHYDPALIDWHLGLLRGDSVDRQLAESALRSMESGIGVFDTLYKGRDNDRGPDQEKAHARNLALINRQAQHLAEAARRLGLWWIAGPKDPLWLGAAVMIEQSGGGSGI